MAAAGDKISNPEGTTSAGSLLKAAVADRSRGVDIKIRMETFQPKPAPWCEEIAALESYFATAQIPAVPVKIDECSTITDVPRFVAGHLSLVKANAGNRIFLPYLERLQRLREILENQTQTINTTIR